MKFNSKVKELYKITATVAPAVYVGTYSKYNSGNFFSQVKNKYSLVTADFKTTPAYEILYHGSRDPSLTKVNDYSSHGFFDAIFAAKDYDDARSHGKYVYEIRLKKDEILEDIPETDQVLSIIKEETKLKNRKKDTEYSRDLDLLYSVIGLEKSSGDISRWVDFDDYIKAPKDADNFELLYHKNKITKQILDNISNLLGEEDPIMLWHEAQRIRGVIAKKLGYKAVSIQDEHGVSYIILPSVLLTLLD